MGGEAGSAKVQGELWGVNPRDWSEGEEPRVAQLIADVLGGLRVEKGLRLLDAGCGAGGPAVKAAERGAVVTGLDASPAMVEYARGRLPQARFDAGDIEALPYRDGEFDAVMAINSVFYCANMANAMRELARVTRSGGRVAITAWGKPEDCQFAPMFAAIVGTLPQKPPGSGPFALSAPGALDGLLEGARLRPSARGASRCVLRSASFAAFWKGCSATGPLQGAMRAVGEEKVKSAVRGALEPLASADGSLELSNSFVWAVGEKA
jgi:SAM-dependent methyltransferase